MTPTNPLLRYATKGFATLGLIVLLSAPAAAQFDPAATVAPVIEVSNTAPLAVNPLAKAMSATQVNFAVDGANTVDLMPQGTVDLATFGTGEGGGSCADSCGGYADGCWCDDLCVEFGDCCPDACDECGLCGGPSGGGPTTSCGDGTCNGSEQCWTCPADCGECGDGGDCCVSSSGLGCSDEACTEDVCAVDPFCCNTYWDGICANQAAELCDVCGGAAPACGDGTCNGSEDCDTCPGDCGECPEPGDCCTSLGWGLAAPGCDDAACEEWVCGTDSFCCDVYWDSLCASTATEECEICGGAPPFCGDGTCQWGEKCDSCPEDCGECPEPGDCCSSVGYADGAPGCDDATCEEWVCGTDSFCCNVYWDSLCASKANDECEVCGGAPPFCGDGTCQWGEKCDSCPGDCGECPEPGDCCSYGGYDVAAPGCDDAECEDLVCSSDPFCCNSVWDGICANSAAELCSVCGGSGPAPGSGTPGDVEFEPGDCCESGGYGSGAGCEDETCTDAVCEVDPFCCNSYWDSICAGEAADLCPDLCGE